MKNLRTLDRKEKKQLKDLLKKYFGFEEKLDFNFFTNAKHKIYIINKELAEVDISNIRINNLGLYIAEMENDKLRLSIEGSQLIGPKATKGILEIDEKKAKEWMMGKDLDSDSVGPTIIKSNNDFLGCGIGKNGKILNYIPKARRPTADI